MSRRVGTIEADYFETLYGSDPDPWRFRTSDYERRKYDATLRALGRARYDRALEVGCSIGVFTALLARRCDALLALDASTVALAAARAACADQLHVTFEAGMVPAGFPAGRFDLIVLSEVVYYLDEADVRALADRCAEALTEHGEVVLCHWLGETDYPLPGRHASDLFAAAMLTRRPRRAILHDETYRLERLWDS